MPDYAPNNIVNIILMLGKYRCNYHQVAELYHDDFLDKQHPNNRTIARLVLRQ